MYNISQLSLQSNTTRQAMVSLESERVFSPTNQCTKWQICKLIVTVYVLLMCTSKFILSTWILNPWRVQALHIRSGHFRAVHMIPICQDEMRGGMILINQSSKDDQCSRIDGEKISSFDHEEDCYSCSISFTIILLEIHACSNPSLLFPKNCVNMKYLVLYQHWTQAHFARHFNHSNTTNVFFIFEKKA